MKSEKLVHVAVGVILNKDGKILIAKRPDNVHQGGLWEFPGGKVNQDETVTQALSRELEEELGLQVIACEPLIQIQHDYSDKSVLLDVYTVTKFSGEVHGKEGQPIQWVVPQDLHQFDFPLANRSIISAIQSTKKQWPDRYAITGAFSDFDDFILKLKNVLLQDIKICQLRIENLNLADHGQLILDAKKIILEHNATVIINTDLDNFSAFAKLSALPKKNVGLHLSFVRAKNIKVRPVSKDFFFGVSCHNLEEIEHAKMIGADYILLSPVQQTGSHPNTTPLGWEKFAELVKLANIPVYALGGLVERDIEQAKNLGAKGVAAISAWWS